MNKETLRSYPPFVDLDFKLAGIKHIIERAQGSPKEIVQAAEYINQELNSCFVDNIQSCLGFIERNKL